MDISEIQGTEYKTFPVQQSARLGLFLAALFLNIGGLYIVYLTHTYWGRAPLVLETMGMLGATGAFSYAVWCLYLWWQAAGWGVAVGEAGLSALDPKRNYPRLVWSEITDIHARSWGGVKLRGPSSKSIIIIRSALVGWEELLGIALEHVSLFQQPAQLPVMFRNQELRTIGLGLCTTFVAAFFLSWGMSEGNRDVWPIWFIFYCSLGLVAFSLPRLISYLFGPRRLVVEETGFSFQKGFTHMQVPFTLVEAVQLGLNKSSGEVTVKATLKRGQKLSLGVFGGDPFAVYRAVRTGWEQHQQDSRPA